MLDCVEPSHDLRMLIVQLDNESAGSHKHDVKDVRWSGAPHFAHIIWAWVCGAWCPRVGWSAVLWLLGGGVCYRVYQVGRA